MNINQQMRELGSMGGVAYAPSEDAIASLVSKTRRARAVRQSTASAAGTLGAAAIGLVAFQAVSATQDDPAFRDRNIINNNDRLTPIERFRANYGEGYGQNQGSLNIDLQAIIDQVKQAAQTEPITPASGNNSNSGSTSSGSSGSSKPSGSSQPSGPTALEVCQAEHADDNYAHKYYDCTKKEWRLKSGWYWDPATGDPYQCNDQPAYENYSYNCSTGKYEPDDGYFWFGNGLIYQNVQWTDAATGATAWGNWSGTGVSWDRKAIFTSGASDAKYDNYIYMGSNATWSGTTCTGVTKSKWGVQVQASCMPESTVAGTGKTYKKHDGIVWVLAPEYQSYKWFSCDGTFEDPANPPEGWTWDGSKWVEVPEPTATASPAP